MLTKQILRTARSRDEVLSGKRGWFEFKNQTADVAEINIYSEIGWFGLTAEDFISELRAVRAGTIDLHINSPGGDVFDGIAIYNALVQHAASVHVTVDGIAASIASVIAMAGDEVTMTRGAMFMVHEPFAMTIGDSRDHVKAAEALTKMGDSIADIYTAKAGGDAESWRTAMRDETWYTAQEAVDAGLADNISGVAAKATFDLSIFRNAPHAPADIRDEQPAPATFVTSTSTQWQNSARLKVATAQLEVRHGNAHRVA